MAKLPVCSGTEADIAADKIPSQCSLNDGAEVKHQDCVAHGLGELSQCSLNDGVEVKVEPHMWCRNGYEGWSMK